LKKISATTVSDSSKRQYHIGLKPGELAEKIVLVGDPARVELFEKQFEKIRVKSSHRQYVTITGTHNGMEISVLATGMGQDATEIAVIECCQITRSPSFIRCGSSGSLKKEVNVGDFVISQASVRLDKTTDYFVHEGYPAFAHSDIVIALGSACEHVGVKFHVGITASAPGFYGAQGREVKGFPVRFSDLPDLLGRQNVTNFEMETSTLFTLAALRGVRAGAVCAVFANRPKDEFGNEAKRKQAEEKSVEITLQAFSFLNQMDQLKAKRRVPIWVPHPENLK